MEGLAVTDPVVSAHGGGLAHIATDSIAITDGEFSLATAVAAIWQLVVEELVVSAPALTATGAGRASLSPEAISISAPALTTRGGAYVILSGDTLTVSDPAFFAEILVSEGTFTALARPLIFTTAKRPLIFTAEACEFVYTAHERTDAFAANERTDTYAANARTFTFTSQS